MIQADQYDLDQAAAGVKNPKPYPRPFKRGGKVERFGNTRGRSTEAVKDLLARAKAGLTG